MKRQLLIFCLPFILFSCQPENRVFIEEQELSPNAEWLLEDKKIFEIPITDTNAIYNLKLSFRFAEGFQYKQARIKITETSPGGTERVQIHDLKIIDENGEYIGDPAYDIWDSEHTIEKEIKFSEKGTYKYTVEHAMPNDPLYLALEVGLILDRAD